MTMLRYFLFPVLGLILLTACGGRSGNTDTRPHITVTMEPQRYFVDAIAGEKVHVTTMVPGGSSPETYDPIPQQLVELNNSQAYLRIGYIGFELAWMERLISNAPHLKVFDLSEGIDLIRADDHVHYDEHGCAHTHEIEPHVWNSAANALIIAKNTFDALVSLDQINESYYRARYDSLCQHIHHTDSLVRALVAEPGTPRTFMIYHPALSYFARDYGFEQIAIEDHGKEPSPAHMKYLIDRCRAEGVRTIFIQPEFDTRNAQAIAEQTGAEVVRVNPLNYRWDEEMLNIARQLTRH